MRNGRIFVASFLAEISFFLLRQEELTTEGPRPPAQAILLHFCEEMTPERVAMGGRGGKEQGGSEGGRGREAKREQIGKQEEGAEGERGIGIGIGIGNARQTGEEPETQFL